MQIIPTARASKTYRFHAKSKRHAVWRQVQKAGAKGVSFQALQRQLRRVTAAQLRGCIAKLRVLKMVRTNGK